MVMKRVGLPVYIAAMRARISGQMKYSAIAGHDWSKTPLHPVTPIITYRDDSTRKVKMTKRAGINKLRKISNRISLSLLLPPFSSCKIFSFIDTSKNRQVPITEAKTPIGKIVFRLELTSQYPLPSIHSSVFSPDHIIESVNDSILNTNIQLNRNSADQGRTGALHNEIAGSIQDNAPKIENTVNG